MTTAHKTAFPSRWWLDKTRVTAHGNVCWSYGPHATLCNSRLPCRCPPSARCVCTRLCLCQFTASGVYLAGTRTPVPAPAVPQTQMRHFLFTMNPQKLADSPSSPGSRQDACPSTRASPASDPLTSPKSTSQFLMSFEYDKLRANTARLPPATSAPSRPRADSTAADILPAAPATTVAIPSPVTACPGTQAASPACGTTQAAQPPPASGSPPHEASSAVPGAALSKSARRRANRRARLAATDAICDQVDGANGPVVTASAAIEPLEPPPVDVEGDRLPERDTPYSAAELMAAKEANPQLVLSRRQKITVKKCLKRRQARAEASRAKDGTFESTVDDEVDGCGNFVGAGGSGELSSGFPSDVPSAPLSLPPLDSSISIRHTSGSESPKFGLGILPAQNWLAAAAVTADQRSHQSGALGVVERSPDCTLAETGSGVVLLVDDATVPAVASVCFDLPVLSASVSPDAPATPKDLEYGLSVIESLSLVDGLVLELEQPRSEPGMVDKCLAIEVQENVGISFELEPAPEVPSAQKHDAKNTADDALVVNSLPVCGPDSAALVASVSDSGINSVSASSPVSPPLSACSSLSPASPTVAPPLAAPLPSSRYRYSSLPLAKSSLSVPVRNLSLPSKTVTISSAISLTPSLSGCKLTLAFPKPAWKPLPTQTLPCLESLESLESLVDLAHVADLVVSQPATVAAVGDDVSEKVADPGVTVRKYTANPLRIVVPEPELVGNERVHFRHRFSARCKRAARKCKTVSGKIGSKFNAKIGARIGPKFGVRFDQFLEGLSRHKHNRHDPPGDCGPVGDTAGDVPKLLRRHRLRTFLGLHKKS